MAVSIKGFSVAIEKDLHPDDAEKVRQAIMQIRGVVGVEMVPVEGSADYLARRRIQTEIGEKIWDVLFPKN